MSNLQRKTWMRRSPFVVKPKYMKRSRLAPQSTSERSRLIRRADRYFSLLLRRETPYCVLCGSTERLTASHFYSRSYLIIRWHPSNVTVMCWDCNLRHSINPHPYLNWLIDKLPEGTLQMLHALRMNRKLKVSDDDIRQVITDCRLKLKAA